MLRFLDEVRSYMPDEGAIDSLAGDLRDAATESPVWSDWLSGVRRAIVTPQRKRPSDHPATSENVSAPRIEPTCLTGLQSFDAMIRMLEKMADRHPVARDILSELYYAEAYDEALDTRDPGTWNDWVRHIEAELAEMPPAN